MHDASTQFVWTQTSSNACWIDDCDVRVRTLYSTFVVTSCSEHLASYCIEEAVLSTQDDASPIKSHRNSKKRCNSSACTKEVECRMVEWKMVEGIVDGKRVGEPIG